MLPSTGYFKTINCPFYDNGFCERPYCHFKHPRREDAANAAVAVGTTTGQAVASGDSGGTTSVAPSNSDMLQKLVSEAVKKVLAHQEVTDSHKISDNIVSQVVEELKPSLGGGALTSVTSAAVESTASNIVSTDAIVQPPVTKPAPCVYNPTPIAELKKRHIPVASYMPTRDSKVAVKRKASPEGMKPWLGFLRNPSATQDSSSTPGYSSVKVEEVTYKPTAIVSTSTETPMTQSYVPTIKSDSSSSNSYEDSNSNDYMSKIKEGYYPKSKKRREEYVPKKLKAPLKTVQHLDETALDDFALEFDMIADILTSEKPTINTVASEDSHEYNLDLEPKFSDDEMPEEDVEILTKETYKLGANSKDNANHQEEKEKENIVCTKAQPNDSDITESRNGNQHSYKSNTQVTDKIDNRDAPDKSTKDSRSSKSSALTGPDKDNKHKGRSEKKRSTKDDSRKESDKEKKDHRHGNSINSSSKDRDKDRKSSNGSSKSIKDKHSKYSSSTSGRHRSSSSSKDDRNKSKSSRSSKESSRSSKDSSKSSRHKSSNSKECNSRHHHKSSSRDLERNKSSISSSKKDTHSSEKHSRPSRTSSTSEKKSSKKQKEDSSERSSDHEEDVLASPIRSIHSYSEEEIIEVSESDDDIEEECLKIFQEYEVSDHPKEVTVKQPPKREVEEIEDSGRKRVAHPSAGTTTTRQVVSSQPPKKLPNPQQRMYERWRLMKEAAATKAAEKVVNIKESQTSPVSNVAATSVQTPFKKAQPVEYNSNDTQLNGNSRIRIAHVPYAMSLTMAKKKVTTANIPKAGDTKTAAQTSKGSRVAHIPQVVPQLVRPEPLQVATQKFPLNVRQYYVNLMQDICVQIYTNADDAAQRALQEEFGCHERCKAVSVYKNSCMLAAHRLRKELDQGSSGDGAGSYTSGIVSHETVLAGKSKGSWSVVKSKKATMNFKGSALYTVLSKWVMSEQQLRDNGFPRPHPDGVKGHAKVYVINTRNQAILSKVPNERFCSRCGQTYMVDKQGHAVQQQNCIYHWGRKFTIRGEGRYSCCQQYGSATGCCDAKTHVWDHVDYENLRGYVKTLPKDVPAEEQGVYALDCEMCYTTQGLELTRVTVINDECHVIYETLVMPDNPIIDHNTRFSGITEENMKGVTTTLRDVQATLLTMFSEKTILVGHSLESDFKALKLIHDTVVDTSVMFPHKNGLPQKRALRNLCSEYLRKIIQNDIAGHDSNEDAVACMELVLWKVKEEAKL
ncbi:RNA exonuclease 1 homolog [Cephus cinctus]|uniref:RNA exonuclease 1 homolog n=1 Tax=Cephus cinctus TaxID=211228 RepID=A0AAJ7BYG4_CEPCN|nr:RNA exonuclease 1 homolog [Cephus cinctus]